MRLGIDNFLVLSNTKKTYIGEQNDVLCYKHLPGFIMDQWALTLYTLLQIAKCKEKKSDFE